MYRSHEMLKFGLVGTTTSQIDYALTRIAHNHTLFLGRRPYVGFRENKANASVPARL
jgi:hypothetical protein